MRMVQGSFCSERRSAILHLRHTPLLAFWQATQKRLVR
jgi:hypothetical protein